MAPRVSVIVVTDGTDAPEQLLDALASIQEQTLDAGHSEILLVGPDVPEPARRMARLWLPLDAACQGPALNQALEHVNTEFVIFADAGSLWRPSKLARQLQALDAAPEAMICVHPVDGGQASDLAKRWDRFGPLICLFMAQPWPLGVAMLRREAIDRLGRFREIPMAEWEMAIRMMLAGCEFIVLPEAMASRQTERKAEFPVLSPAVGSRPFIREHLEDMGVKDLFRHTVLKSVPDGYAFKAGLYNLHDCLGECHAMLDRAELIGESQAAVYWRGIMHRRLQRFDDARRRLRGLDTFPIADELHARADAVMATAVSIPEVQQFRTHLASLGRWDPTAFVDWCELLQEDDASEAAVHVAERIQHLESRLLLTATYKAALRELPE